MTRRILEHRWLRLGSWLAVWAVLAGGLMAASGRADAPHPRRNEQYKRQVEKLEEAWRAAEMSGDADAMDKLLSDDYVGITMTGQVVTKTQQLDRMRNRSMVVKSIALTDVKVKLIGTTAVVTSLADVDGTNDGEPMHGMYRYTRVYTRLPTGSWRITNFEATRVGQPQVPGGRRPPPPDEH
jgi:ketosteroid isomerase-like protein